MALVVPVYSFMHLVYIKMIKNKKINVFNLNYIKAT